MTKREVLIAICENPGWEPPQPIASSVDRALGELITEGWIASRLDGWESTPQAIEAYPQFAQQRDIRDLNAQWATGQLPHEPHTPLASIERVLPLMTLREGQRMEGLIDGFGIRGTVTIANTSQRPDIREVEIVVRVREPR